MKGFILAAGVGSRLKPWTDSHPKALAPVGGIPMLQRVIEKMLDAGITDITVNVCHFADQIIDFLKKRGYGGVKISDERSGLLETGGAILKAMSALEGGEPILIHNADILSNADFRLLEAAHGQYGSDATLLISDRESSRKLLFDGSLRLRGWLNKKTGDTKPDGLTFPYSVLDAGLHAGDAVQRYPLYEKAFAGIYILSPSVFQSMRSGGWQGRFSIIDFFISTLGERNYKGWEQRGMELIDIGKPDSYNRANLIIKNDVV